MKEYLRKRLHPNQIRIFKKILLPFKRLELYRNLSRNLKSKFKLPHKILIGTHHKTGTIWLGSIFNEICFIHSLIFHHRIRVHNGKKENLPTHYDIYFENHSAFDLDSIGTPFRGLHMIRDPRDVIISGCFYHQKAVEKWLHLPRKEFQGLTYQQKINSYNNIDDQILFEMKNYGRKTIEDMLLWDYTYSSFYEIKYENLILDTDLNLFHKIFIFLGFPGKTIPYLLLIAHKNSLFSGKINHSTHIRSGKSGQWKKYFKPIHQTRFFDLFGDALIKLEAVPKL